MSKRIFISGGRPVDVAIQDVNLNIGVNGNYRLIGTLKEYTGIVTMNSNNDMVEIKTYKLPNGEWFDHFIAPDLGDPVLIKEFRRKIAEALL